MNIGNILKVADAIEQHSIPDLGFNMAIWHSEYSGRPDKSGHNCGTVACIGGWTLRLFGEDTKIAGSRVAAELLGLDEEYELEDALFCPPDWHTGKYPPSQAVAVLRHLAETGKVDWSVPAPTAEEQKP